MIVINKWGVLYKNKTPEGVVKAEQRMSVFIIKANYGEDFKENSFFSVEGKRYKVFKSEERGTCLNPQFRIWAKYKPQLTKYNYDNVDWVFEVINIERLDQLTVVINMQQMKTIITLETPAECLQEFLMLKQLHKEAMSNEEFYKLRY